MQNKKKELSPPWYLAVMSILTIIITKISCCLKITSKSVIMAIIFCLIDVDMGTRLIVWGVEWS